jgi:hypothetical protein
MACMKLAFIVDPLDDFIIYKDTTYAIVREAAAPSSTACSSTI